MNSGTKLIIVGVVILFAAVGLYYGIGPQQSTANTPKVTAPAPKPSPTNANKPTTPPSTPPTLPPTLPNPPSTPNTGTISPGLPPSSLTPNGPKPASGLNPSESRSGDRPAVDPHAPPTSGGKGDSTNPPAITPNPTTPNGVTPPNNTPTNPANPSGPRPVTPISPNPTGPVTPPALPVNSANAVKSHTVASGDTMSSIAEKYYGDKNKWQAIAKANPLVDPSAMKVGTKLTIPAATTDAPKPVNVPAPTTPASTATATGEKIHVVASGDTLAALARTYYGNPGLWETIYDANKKTIGDDPEALKVGMKLTIPKR